MPNPIYCAQLEAMRALSTFLFASMLLGGAFLLLGFLTPVESDFKAVQSFPCSEKQIWAYIDNFKEELSRNSAYMLAGNTESLSPDVNKQIGAFTTAKQIRVLESKTNERMSFEVFDQKKELKTIYTFLINSSGEECTLEVSSKSFAEPLLSRSSLVLTGRDREIKSLMKSLKEEFLMQPLKVASFGKKLNMPPKQSLFVYTFLLLFGLACTQKSPSANAGSGQNGVKYPLATPDSMLNDPVLQKLNSTDEADSLRFPEAPYYASEKEGFKSAHQMKFGFMVDIPANWKAFNKSHITDGYFISPKEGDTAIDIRVYATNIIEGFESIHLQDCESVTEFVFSDQTTGTECIQGNKQFYFREKDSRRLAFFVEASQDWLKRNEKTIHEMASSLRFDEPNSDTNEAI